MLSEGLFFGRKFRAHILILGGGRSFEFKALLKPILSHCY